MYGERKKNISQASISCIDGLPRYALCVGRLPRCSEASPICGHRRQHSRCRASSWSPAAWRSPRCAAPPLPRRRRLVEPSLHRASSSGRWSLACTSSSVVGSCLVELSLHRASSSLARLSAAVWRSRPCTAAPPGCCGDLFFVR
jgi:hypothetical protein